MTVLDVIKAKANVSFRPADAQELEQLRLLGVPTDVLSFFQEHQPTECAEINNVRLWPIAHILTENRDYVPGADIQPLGYVVFATTIYGDAFCLATKGTVDAQTAPIVLVAHDLNWEDPEFSRRLPELAKPVADNFNGFLEAFAAETLELTPLYPE